MSHLKACTAVDAMPGSPRRHDRPPGPGTMTTSATARPEGSAASMWVLFSVPLVSSPLQQEQLRICPGTVFLLPRGEVFACPGPAAPSQPPQRQYPQRQRKQTFEDQPLTSSALLPRPVFGGEPCGGCLRPWFVATPAWQQPCTPAPL